MNETYIFGHQNPDTDATLSSICYGKYLESKWMNIKVIKLWELNNETKYLLNLLDIEEPPTVTNLAEWSDIVLTDHNDKSQSIADREKYNILQVIDHHNFGNFSTGKPAFIRAEPLCSSCSVIYKIFVENNYSIDQKTASMLIAAILSDSLFWKSPTSTDEDKEIVNKLNQIAEIKDLEKFAMDMFAAKSDLGDISIEEIIKSDYKMFEVNGTKFGVGVLETTNPAYSLDKKEAIAEELNNIRTKSWLDFIMFSVVDIIQEVNTTISGSDEDKKIISEAFWVDFEWCTADLGNVLSRKKQVIPVLNKYFG